MARTPAAAPRIVLAQLAASRRPAENRERLAALEVPPAEIVVLPEVFQRDLGSPDDDLGPDAEDLDGPFVQALTERAAAHGGTWIAGMVERTTDGRPFNTLVAVGAAGLLASYRKIHLYDSFGYLESDRLVAGERTPVLLDVGGLSVGLMTCYDLRFPELARELSRAGADLLVVPAAWVAGPRKVAHWRTLATARAVENLAYVAAVGQPGPRYSGHSLVVDPRGEVVAEAGDEDGALVRAEISLDLVAEAREENPSLGNRRDAEPWPEPQRYAAPS
ncbi:carbon-nitrogen hydrolase family protein [Nocardioides sp. HDW12B]|uniref:carbon-nitrogen hydrolase family protein n=1 Tax=Nocardioides sp. HDW12B TaxID=2714939 RepID=UPI00140E82DC|nr:carbon-nitrogen hydrolase family protein [Nocardioides sp. HDW12B]QIK68080.1 carbon-nitrogen hydrolase family protein [Nocardioides sp. HDW12B]